MESVLLLEGISLIFLLACSALFSASETALLGLGRVRLAQGIEKGGKTGKALEVWEKDPNSILTTILILNNSVNVASSTIAAFFAVQLAELFHWPHVQTATLVAAAVTLNIILFGEVTPKIFAIHKSEMIALAMIRPMVGLAGLLRVLIQTVVKSANLLLRPFGLKPGRSVPMITEEEIRTLIQLGAEEGIIEDKEQQMLHRVITLGETQVREVMVPRIEMECIDADETMDRIIDHIVQTGYSRMPVYRNSMDNIIGIIYTKDIITMLQYRELIVLQDILRPPHFVPETKKVDELLREFQRGNMHLAVVVDEYGGTSGLVTLEDLLEEIVGEIRDEYDVEERKIEKLTYQTWLADGNADIREVNEALETDLPDMKDINTLGGYMAHVLGHVPKKGEQVAYQNYQFKVILASSRKVDKIQIQRQSVPVSDSEQSPSSEISSSE